MLRLFARPLLAVGLFLTSLAAWAHGISEADKQRMLDGGYLQYVSLGASHMLTGYDHLLFLFGVVFSSGTQQPITAALIALTSSGTSVHQYNVEAAAVLIAALPTLLIYFFGGRYFVRGLTQGAIK